MCYTTEVRLDIFLIGIVPVAVAGSIVYSLWVGDWSIFRAFFIFLSLSV